ncbi:MAG TPA: sigma-70 family RNA polymerase sigma factor [Blastocatellia bacterium]|nr:sigma-70 family RNA polymerase sigma factor [Blastocatellia bacterium]
MADNTEIRSDRFPITRISAIVAARSDDQAERTRAFESLIAAYWMPVYKYTRLKWNKPSEDAKDLTQGFFAEAMEKRFFDRYDPSKAKFRTFLRTCLDGFIANENKAASRIKRGGNATILSLDFDGAESQLMSAAQPAANAIDEFFDREWARSVLSLALERFRAQMTESGKVVHLRLFERYVLEEDEQLRPSYKALADEFKISTSDVTNYLAYSRREFRRIVLEKLRELTATDDEFRRETRALLGVEPE